MEAEIIRVTDKCQISIPRKIQKASNISKGDRLLIVTSKNTITMRKITKDSFKDLQAHSEGVARKLWNNIEDDVWDEV